MYGILTGLELFAKTFRVNGFPIKWHDEMFERK